MLCFAGLFSMHTMGQHLSNYPLLSYRYRIHKTLVLNKMMISKDSERHSRSYPLLSTGSTQDPLSQHHGEKLLTWT